MKNYKKMVVLLGLAFNLLSLQACTEKKGHDWGVPDSEETKQDQEEVKSDSQKEEIKELSMKTDYELDKVNFNFDKWFTSRELTMNPDSYFPNAESERGSLLVLHGTIENPTDGYIDVVYKGSFADAYFLINDVKYHTTMRLFTPNGDNSYESLAPLQKCEFALITDIPDSVISPGASMVLRISNGFIKLN